MWGSVKWSRWQAVLLLFLPACSEPIVKRPYQDSAVKLVLDYYGADDTMMIEWREDVCPGYDATAVVYDGKCYSGLTFGEYSLIALRGSYSSSAFAHELLHAAMSQKGIYDPEHKRDEWGVLVPVANDMLKVKGW